MGINKLVFAALTTACLVSAGVGGYMAVRLSQPAATVAPSPAAPTAEPVGAAPGTVTESEGVIAPEAVAPPVAAPPTAEVQPAPAPTPARAVEPARPRPARTSAPSRPAPSPEIRRAERSPAPPPAAPPAAPAPSPAPVTQNAGSMWETRPSIEPEPPPVPADEPPPPPAPEFVDLQVPADAVLGLQVERTVSSELARVEDKVSARVTRDVRVGSRIAIPAGAIVSGSVTEVERGGKMKGKSRLAVRFHTVTLADGTQLALRTDPVVREGQSPSGETAAKVGGAAIGGAILGAILGGGRGAAIGAGVGAGAGTAAAMTNERNAATLPAGTNITVRVQQPVTVTVQKE